VSVYLLCLVFIDFVVVVVAYNLQYPVLSINSCPYRLIFFSTGKGKVTAKTHPFKPPASLQEALDFLKAQRVQNCMLVFTNSSALSFAEGQYLDFDDFSEDDDE
jgi:hypothetical protein